jgi:hypothetical protein
VESERKERASDSERASERVNEGEREAERDEGRTLERGRVGGWERLH